MFTDSESDNTWYRLWTGNAAGTDGDWVDTSSFNSYGNGWIEADNLASLDPDYAQGTAEQDTDLWVQTWNATDGVSIWEHGAVNFSNILSVQQTSEVEADTAFGQMFTDLDLSATGDIWYQFWVGDASGEVDDWAFTSHGQGWVQASDLATETFTAPAGGESTELWVRSYNTATTDYSGWEHWTVTNTSNAAPVATSDSYTGALNTGRSDTLANLVSNDTDADGDTLTATINTDSAVNGDVGEVGDSFTFIPDADVRTGSFTYSVSDGSGGADTGTVNLSFNSTPTASDSVSNGTQAGIYYVETARANAGAPLTEAEIALIGVVNTDAALTAGEFELL